MKSEYDEQVELVSWLESKGLKFSAVPSSTYTTSWKQKTRNKMMGVRAGVPDLFVLTPLGVIWIEMKIEKGGVVSEHQKGFIDAINATPHTEAKVCKGAAEAIKFVSEFL